MKKITNLTLAGTALCLLSLTTQGLMAEEQSSTQRAIDYRSSLMGIYSWNLKAMGAMVKGEAPFDAARFNRLADDLASAAQLDLIAGFPEGSDGGETDAKAEVWMTPDDFRDKYQALQEKSAALAKAASAGDLEAIRPVFGAAANTCKECHKAYKN